jgi:hypothetical protein
MKIGKPIVVDKKDDITSDDIEKLHQLYMNEMDRLFERTKIRNGCHQDTKLIIY